MIRVRREKHHRRVESWLFGCAFTLLLLREVSLVASTECPTPVIPPAGENLAGKVPFRFAVVGDNRGNQSVFEDILSRIKREKVALILHTGDIVREYTVYDFKWVLHELNEERLKIPFCPAPGNHDVDSRADSINERYLLYRRSFGPRRYWFSYGDVLFVAFDGSSARANDENLAWLEKVLMRMRSNYELCFVYFHIPVSDPRLGWNHAMMPDSAKRLKTILKKYEVSAVFNGHIHSYVEGELEGIPVYITDGAGASLRPPLQAYHYLIVTVNRDRSFSVERKVVPDRIDADYAEYLFRVGFPNRSLAFVALGLLLLGLTLRLVRRKG